MQGDFKITISGIKEEDTAPDEVRVVNLSQLAMQTGYSIAHISRVLRKQRNPSVKCLRKLATVLGYKLGVMDEMLKAGMVRSNPVKED